MAGCGCQLVEFGVALPFFSPNTTPSANQSPIHTTIPHKRSLVDKPPFQRQHFAHRSCIRRSPTRSCARCLEPCRSRTCCSRHVNLSVPYLVRLSTIRNPLPIYRRNANRISLTAPPSLLRLTEFLDNSVRPTFPVLFWASTISCLLLWWWPKAPTNGLGSTWKPTPRPRYGQTLVYV